MLFSIGNLWADGSKDWYPSGATGHRAHLLGAGYIAEEAIPFPNRGAHYVYAKPGERITLASSAQNGGQARIQMWGPNGNRVVNNTTGGQIPNRTAELAGPRLYDDSSSGGYTPIYYQVPSGGEGIYRVEFESRSSDGQGSGMTANGNWNQGSNAAIVAWDISVINTNNSDFIPGRVYATNLNLSTGGLPSGMSGNNYHNVKFNGTVYTRTHDGYTYRVSHKGSNGIVFAFFVNNNGFFDMVDGEIQLLYKSQNTLPSVAKDKLHNPNTKDTEIHITHKMFYVPPASDMPAKANASIGISNGTGAESPLTTETWLFNLPIVPEISNVKVIGAEGSEGRLGHKGGRVNFDASIGGQYRIVLESNNPGFTPRVLTGSAVQGANSIVWDGKDGAGNIVSGGALPFNASVVLQGAEVHFPFFDIEYNIDGIVIELLENNNPNAVVTDKVFWDDSDITREEIGNTSPNGSATSPVDNSHMKEVSGGFNLGENSNTNGHKFGANPTGNGFATWGDQKSLDTWTFIQGEEDDVDFTVDLIEVDLYTEVSYNINGQSNPPSATVGDQITFTVTAGNKSGFSDLIADPSNNVPGAPFTFHLPGGMEIDPSSVTAMSNCSNGNAEEVVPLSYDETTRMFSSELSLPSGCSITYTFTGVLSGGMGSQVAEATIMRTADITDVDATNGEPSTAPTNPHFECYNNDEGNLGTGSGSIGCNNISERLFMLLDDCVDEVLYFEDFGTTTFAENSGRKPWVNQASISLNSDGSFAFDSDGNIKREGPIGGVTTYLFAPGQEDPLYNSANASHSAAASVARIKNGYYSVNPPGYVQMGIPESDLWSIGEWDPNAATNDPDDPASNYDWTKAWDKEGAIRDMSGAVNGAAFLVRGAASASQSIKPFYEFDIPGTISNGETYTLSMYSYVTYHDKDYMLMDVIDKNTGFIYASVPLTYPGLPDLPPGASPEGFSLGWVPLQASVKFDSQDCEVDIAGKEVKIAIRGSQDRSLETGKGFGHTLIDDISFTKRLASCDVPATEITCEDACYSDVQGKFKEWHYPDNQAPSNPVVENFTQPGTDGGFVLDIYYLDNSFNMNINGIDLYDEELEFQYYLREQNVRFKSDGAKWEDKDGNGNLIIDDIWKIYQHEDITEQNKDSYTPVIRVKIDKYGNVSLFGIRQEFGVLEELEVFDSNGPRSLNKVHWFDENSSETNKIKVVQDVIGVTAMTIYGYGQNQKECEFCDLIKDGIFDDNDGDGFAQAGETITYTFDVINAGDMAIHGVEIVDPLLGPELTITLDENTHEPIPDGVTFEGDINNNGILDVNETWKFTVKYTVTDEDIYQNEGVYNQAKVTGIGKIGTSEFNVDEDSVPTEDNKQIEGRDPDLPNHTFVPLEGNGLIITNPMIYQKTE